MKITLKKINNELEEGYRQQTEIMNEIYMGKVLKKEENFWITVSFTLD